MKETNDEYYDPYRYLDFECYNDSEVLEICGVCLKLRATSNLWIRPDEHILSFFYLFEETPRAYNLLGLLGRNLFGKNQTLTTERN